MQIISGGEGYLEWEIQVVDGTFRRWVKMGEGRRGPRVNKVSRNNI